jgi:hypothetical protein
MAVSRRSFIVAGQTLLAAAALPIKFFGAATGIEPGSPNSSVLASATKATFLPLVNSSFAIVAGSLTNAWLTLLSVKDMNPKTSGQTEPMAFGLKPTKAATASTDTFALHFYGTGETLEQGTYEVKHRTLGQFSLFIVPAGPSLYTAVISHLLSAAPVTGPKPLNSKAQMGAPAAL